MPGQGRLESREHLEASLGDPEAVAARGDLGAAHLQDAQPAPVDRPVCLVLELDDPVGDGELGLGTRLGRLSYRIRRPISAVS